jgi:voltage-gated potassium channel
LRLHTVIFEADTRAGRLFDLWLIVVILVSMAAVVIDSVQGLGDDYRSAFSPMEWLLTIAFTLKYLARLACVHYPLRYAPSFFVSSTS